MNNKLNVNVIFCEEYDEDTNSYKNVFDNMNIKEVSINHFHMVLFVNRIRGDRFDLVASLCKMKEKGNRESVDRIVAMVAFEIPQENKKEENIGHGVETFISQIDTDKLKGEGMYRVLVFARESQTNKKITIEDIVDLDSFDLISTARLKVN